LKYRIVCVAPVFYSKLPRMSGTDLHMNMPAELPASVADPVQLLRGVAQRLEQSRPAASFRWAGPVVMGAWIGVVLAWLLKSSHEVVAMLQIIAWGVTLCAVLWLWFLQRAHRREINELDDIEDAVARKFYAESAGRLNRLLSKPMRTPPNRLRAMVLAGAVLGRSKAHDDAILIYNELLDIERLAGPGGVMIRVGRAMAMLHADHLYDADRAISDLRRLIDRGGARQQMQQFMDEQLPADDSTSAPDAAPEDASDASENSSVDHLATDPASVAGLRLVELYRDIKTGHIEEAVALFHAGLDVLRLGLGQRVGDAYALLAVALDRLGDIAAAQQAVLDATVMQPAEDLQASYPEFAPLLKKYPVTPLPVMG
jgi:tetratricopeptide (TPR) repeat protein